MKTQKECIKTWNVYVSEASAQNLTAICKLVIVKKKSIIKISRVYLNKLY